MPVPRTLSCAAIPKPSPWGTKRRAIAARSSEEMDGIGILDRSGLVLVFSGLAAVMIAVVRIYHDSINQVEKRRAAGLSPDRP
ncbi:hypothetical protein Kisp02_59770 [Kineosporia sp. NBRC 101731]|nr:hypothetical protein Kisp02_59770 [Kineosporia sp. NBRC 101731]